MDSHRRLLADADASPEAFVRHGLARLEADFREMALLALADWERLEIVAPALFPAVTGLQRPSWGSWNGLLAALKKARRAVLREGSAAQRGAVEGASTLGAILARLEEKPDPELVASLGPIDELTRSALGKRSRVSHLLALPITLRNRVAHDAPTEEAWWRDAADALRPLIAWHADARPCAFVERGTAYPEPWFLEDGDEVWACNGLDRDFSVRYVSAEGRSRHAPERSQAMLLALQRLVGKADARDSDFKKLLGHHAPEEIRGVMLGDYLVGAPVGQGGFAVVHAGRQLSTGRKVAVKVLHDGMPEEARERFQREAAYLSRLEQHPHVVDVIGYGEETWSAPRQWSLSDEPWFEAFSKGAAVKSFIVLGWVEGSTLDDLVSAKPEERPDLRRIAGWFAQAASALEAVHASGMIHRDIKPANLMIDDQDDLVLMDFGIARSHDENRTLVTEAGSALGTPAYMSPEQIRAADAESEVGPATDVYSLCAAFYELFTATRLYDHDTVAAVTVRTRKLEGVRPERPSLRFRSLPWELETILLGGLEPEAADRYRSAAAIERDVLRFLADEPIEYRRPSLWRRVQLGYRRNRRFANIVGLFAILAVLLVVQIVLARNEAVANAAAARKQSIRATANAERAERERAEADRLRVRAEEQRIAAQRTTYALYKDKHALARKSGESDAALLWLRAAIDIGRACGVDVRPDEALLRGALGSVSRVAWRLARAYPLLTTMVQPDPTGPIWAANTYVGRTGLLRGTTRDGGSSWRFEHVLDDHEAPVLTAVGLDPISGRVVSFLDGKLVTIDPDTAEVVGVHPPGDATAQGTALQVTADGRAFAVFERQLLAIRLDDGSIAARHPLPFAPGDRFDELRVDEDRGRAIVRVKVGPKERRLAVVDLEDGAELLSVPVAGNSPGSLFAAGGRAAYVGSDGAVTAIDYRGPTPSAWRRETPWTWGQALTIDDGGIAILTEEGNVRTWSVEGELIATRPVPAFRDTLRRARLPSGVWVSGVGDLGVVDELHDSEARAVYRSPVNVSAPIVVDRATLALAVDETLELRSVADGEIVGRVPIGDFAGSIAYDRTTGVAVTLRDGALHAWDEDGEVASSADVALPASATERARVLTEVPLVVLPHGAGIVAATTADVVRFDAATMMRRERIAAGRARVVRVVDEGAAVAVVRENAELGRFEVLRYDLATATLDTTSIGRPRVIVPVRIADVTARAIDASGHRLVWGTPSGEVRFAELPVASPGEADDASPGAPPTSVEGTVIANVGAAVGAVAFLDADVVVVGDAEGRVHRIAAPDAGLDGPDRRWTAVDQVRMQDEIVALVPIDARRVMVRSQRADAALVAFAGLSRSRPHPSGAIDSWNLIQRDGLRAWIEGPEIVVERGAEVTRLRSSLPIASLEALDVSARGDAVIVQTGARDNWQTLAFTLEPGTGWTERARVNTNSSREDGVRFVSDDEAVVFYENRWALVRLRPGEDPALQRRGAFDGAGTLVDAVRVGERLVFAERGAARLHLVDDAGNAPAIVSLPGAASVVAAAGDRVLAGGQGAVHVIDPVAGRLERSIVLEGESRRVIALAATDGIVAAGTWGGILLARLGDDRTRLRLSVADEVRRLHLTGDGIAWVGASRHGWVALPELEGELPGMDRLEAMTRRELRHGEVRSLDDVYDVRPPTSGAKEERR